MSTQLTLPFPETAATPHHLVVLRDQTVIHTFGEGKSFDDLVGVREILVAWWPQEISHDGDTYSDILWEDSAKPTGWYGIEPDGNHIWCLRIEPFTTKDN